MSEVPLPSVFAEQLREAHETHRHLVEGIPAVLYVDANDEGSTNISTRPCGRATPSGPSTGCSPRTAGRSGSGGHCRIESEPGRRTSVSAWLPLAEPDSANAGA